MEEDSKLKYKLSTDAFAEHNLVLAQSVRARLCRTGSFHGIVPLRLASGRLAWPAVQVTK